MTWRPHFSRLLTSARSLRFGRPTWLRVPGWVGRSSQVLSARRATRRLSPKIKEAQAALVTFDELSGKEFGALAEGLVPLDARLSDVREQAALLDHVLRDHDDDRALSSAFDLYKRSVDLAHASIGMALSQEEQMEQMESRLLHNRDSFAQSSLMFRVLVVGIRTEAARIDPENSAVFRGLADEIDYMANRMSQSVDDAFGQIEAIVSEASAGRVQLKALQADLHTRAQASVKLLRDELDKIKQGLAPCLETSDEVARLLEEARTQTSELITSMQYQDIVRQRLEHVSHGFDDLAGHLGAGAGIDCGYVHQAAKVQQTHLNSSRQSIEEATGRLADGGRRLLDTGSALVSRLEAMERETKTVFLENRAHQLFRRETENLVAIASQSEQTNQRIQRLLERIEESVNVFFTDIRSHELEVVHVSLNSQIAAARVPDAGALSKLAEEIARLAAHTAGLTRAVGEQLNETLGGLRTIRAEADSVCQSINAEKAELASGAVVVGEKLARLNDNIQTKVGSVVRQFNTAYQAVERLLPRLQLVSLVGPAFAPSHALCEGMLAATAAFAEDGVGADGQERLATHRSRYTMRQEHEAHLAADAPAAPGGIIVTSETGWEGTTDRDDIELFGDAVEPPRKEKPAPVAPVSDDDGIELF